MLLLGAVIRGGGEGGSVGKVDVVERWLMLDISYGMDGMPSPRLPTRS